MGGHAPTRYSLLPAQIPQHLPRRPSHGSRRPRVAPEEQIPATGTEHIHVRIDGHQSRVRCLHGIPPSVFQTAANSAGATFEAAVIFYFFYFAIFTLLCFLAEIASPM